MGIVTKSFSYTVDNSCGSAKMCTVNTFMNGIPVAVDTALIAGHGTHTFVRSYIYDDAVSNVLSLTGSVNANYNTP